MAGPGRQPHRRRPLRTAGPGVAGGEDITAPEQVYAGHTISGADAAGSFSVDFTIHADEQSRVLTGLVDTRRLYSIVPTPILEELGVKREEYRRFRREDGFVRQLGIGLARLELHGKTASVYIVFGDDPQETVIGSMTLTVFGLAADPIQERPVIRTVDIMTAIPHITEAAIRAKVTAKSFARGEAYYCQGAVESATRRGSQLFAAVQGSEWEPYRVGVAITDGDFTASCTCPYDWEGYCKHIVATLLTYINPDDGHSVPIATATPIADLLAGLDAPALRTLVNRLIATDPALADIVDEFCDGG